MGKRRLTLCILASSSPKALTYSTQQHPLQKTCRQSLQFFNPGQALQIDERRKLIEPERRFPDAPTRPSKALFGEHRTLTLSNSALAPVWMKENTKSLSAWSGVCSPRRGGSGVKLLYIEQKIQVPPDLPLHTRTLAFLNSLRLPIFGSLYCCQPVSTKRVENTSFATLKLSSVIFTKERQASPKKKV